MLIICYVNDSRAEQEDISYSYQYLLTHDLAKNEDFVGKFYTCFQYSALSEIVFTKVSGSNAYNIDNSTGMVYIEDQNLLHWGYDTLGIKVCDGIYCDTFYLAITVKDADSCIFIDPGYTGTASGSYSQPYNSWEDINKELFKPGYAYLQKRGTIYYGKINLTVSGTKKKPIIIGSYGKGSKPIIDGQRDDNRGLYLGNWIDAIQHYKIYDIYVTNFNEYGILVGPNSKHIRFYNVETHNNGTAGEPNPNFYIYNTDDDSKKFIKVLNLITSGAAEHGIKCQGAGIEIINLLSHNNNQGSGIQFSGELKPVIQCYSSSLKYGCLYENLSGINIQGDTISIERIKTYNNNNGVVFNDEPKYCYITDIESYNNTYGINISGEPDNIFISNTYLYSNIKNGVHITSTPKNIQISKSAIYNNQNNGIAVNYNINNININYNLIYNNENAGIEILNSNIIEIYNNTLYNIDSLQDIVINSNSPNIIMQNNIAACNDEDFKQSNNIDYTEENVMFVDASSIDFRLFYNSPAIDAGIDIGINYDYNSNYVPYGEAPDIGALEFIFYNPSDTLPNTPADFTGYAISYDQIKIQWNDNSENEYGFEIERSLTPEEGFQKIFTTYQNINSYNNVNLTPLTDYYYRIRAFNNIGYSDYSEEISISTPPIPPPVEPSSLRTTNIKARSASLRWNDNSDDEDIFELERSDFSDSAYTKIAVLNSNQTEYTDNSLSPVTNYFYRIRACNEHGCSDYSNELNVTTLELRPPDNPPTDLSASDIAKHSVLLHWTDNSSNEDGFYVYRSLTSGSGFVHILTTSANATQITDTGLDPITTYYYKVRAFNEDGYSEYTNEIGVTTLEFMPPAAPSQLSASNITKNSVTLSWTDNANNENGFHILRSNISGSGYAVVATVSSNINSYNDTGLSYDTHYYYVVRAYNDDGNSDYTNEINVKTLELRPPAAPTQLSGSNITNNSVTLSWLDNSDNEDGFYIVRSNTSGSNYVHVISVGANVTSYSNTGLSPDTDYYYMVRAFNDDGHSSYTDEFYIRTLQLIPPVEPENLSATNVTENSLDLTWTDNSDNETGFVVLRSASYDNGYIQAGTTGANINTFHDSGLSHETYYFYKVYATNDDGNSGYSNTIKAKTLKPAPAAPDSLSVINITKTSVDISWTDNSDNENGFNVIRSAYIDSGYTQAGTAGANTNTFHDDGLSPGTFYFYKIGAYNENGSSEYTEALKIKTLDPQPPAAPSHLKAYNISKHSVDLLWTDNSDNEDGFYIIRSEYLDSGYIKVATVKSNVTNFYLKGLDKNTLYFFKIEAFNTDGYSGYSNAIKVLTLETELPMTPSELSATDISNNSVSLSWTDNSDNEDGFEILRSTLLNSQYTPVAMVPANDNTFEDKELMPNTPYYYKLRAFNEDGYSGYSNILQVKTPQAILPEAPSSLKSDTAGFDYITISWIDNSNNESGFSIERTTDTSKGYLASIDINTPDLTIYKDSGLVPNTTYYYRVSAYNDDGYSDFTNELESKTLSNVPPSPPSSLLASEISLNSITLKWQDNSNDETGFIIKRAISANNNFVPLITIQANDTIFVDNSVMPNTTYYYLVNAVNYAGNSNNSNTAVASTFSVSESKRVWEGLVAYYNFNINSNNVVKDYSNYKKPLDLAIDDVGGIIWKTNNSIEIIANTVIKSIKPATKIVNACKKTNEITLECWIKPESYNPSNQSSILSISNDSEDIGASIFQTNISDLNSNLFSYAINLKTKATSGDGSPAIYSENEFSYVSLQHLVYVKDKNGIEKIYLDGEEVANSIRPKELDNWKDDYFLMMGNNMSQSNPWYGTYYVFAIYNSALSREQILVNYNAGPADNVTDDLIEYKVEITPNPSQGLFNVKIIPQTEAELVSKTLIQICDLMGNVLSSVVLKDPCQELIKTFNLTTYPKGMYILRIISDEHSSCSRFIIQ